MTHGAINEEISIPLHFFLNQKMEIRIDFHILQRRTGLLTTGSCILSESFTGPFHNLV